MKTHKVVDIFYHEEEGQDCFVGTLMECIEFETKQNSIGLVIVPMTKEEIDNYPDNN